jgi:hypothetical protein
MYQISTLKITHILTMNFRPVLYDQNSFLACMFIFAIADSSLDEIITFKILILLFSELDTVTVLLRVFA